MLQRKEMTALLINVISLKMLLTFPRIFIINSGNAAWIQALYNTAAVFLIFFVTTKLYRGNKNVIQLAETAGGKPLKIIVGMTVFAVLLINFSSVVRIFPESVKSVLLQNFKLEVIVITFVIATAIGAYIGLQSVAKVNYLFLPVAGAVLLAFLLLLIPYYRFSNIMPVFGQGYKAILGKGFNTVSLFSDILFLNILLPHCENAGEARKSGVKALVIGAGISVIILLGYCLVYPYPASKEFIIPVYQLARIIHLSSFFSRFEALFQFVWSILVLLYSSVYVYTMCYVWQITFNLKFYRPLIFPVVLISSVIAMVPNSMLDLISTEEIRSLIVYPIAFLLPLIFGAVSRRYYGERMRKDESDEKV